MAVNNLKNKNEKGMDEKEMGKSGERERERILHIARAFFLLRAMWETLQARLLVVHITRVHISCKIASRPSVLPIICLLHFFAHNPFNLFADNLAPAQTCFL